MKPMNQVNAGSVKSSSVSASIRRGKSEGVNPIELKDHIEDQIKTKDDQNQIVSVSVRAIQEGRVIIPQGEDVGNHAMSTMVRYMEAQNNIWYNAWFTEDKWRDEGSIKAELKWQVTEMFNEKENKGMHRILYRLCQALGRVDRFKSGFRVLFKQYYLQNVETWLRLEGVKKEGCNDEHKRYEERQNDLKTWRSMLCIAGAVYSDGELSEMFNQFNHERKRALMVLLDILGPTRNNETVKHLVGNEAFEQLCRMQEARRMIGDSNMIGLRDWFNVYGVVVMDIPALPDNIAQILNSDCGIHEDRKVKDTHRLVLMPKEVVKNGKTIEVTFESYCNPNDGLISDVKTAHKAHSKIYKYGDRLGYEGKEKSWSRVSVGKETMWCLVVVGDENKDNGILKGSRNKTWDEQVRYVNDVNNDMATLVRGKKLAVSKGEKTGELYSIARPLELAILAMGFYNKGGGKVLTYKESDKANSYARTEDKWQGWRSGSRVGVGSFGSDGLDVDYHLVGNQYGFGGLGVLRKFC